MTRDHRGTTALITGASAGIGAEFAAQLASRGADLVLVARREDRLRELADRLAREHGITATPIALDVSRADAAATLRREIDERGIRIHTLIGNAGFGMKGDFAVAGTDRIDEMVRVNVGALVSITREFLPGMLADGRGVLVNVASTGAYQPCPNMAVYGATKAFVLSFTEALAYETKGSGLGVLALSPGATRTEFFEVVGTPDAAVGRFKTPARVVARALGELDRRRPRASVVVGRTNAVTAWASRVMPRRLTLELTGRVLQ
ncbi:SDR family NAD(P)-dependent oxidoreductase [Microbacterium sp. SSM24]|uniref:SDR family NAD(P)-dependent oxidoreductase n=1 Tax=Microbacterium sp. SSM24 TaxID=2991714 RepID=UPI00222640FA|nr:SDR family oxidoreductase [Microbacterium sp. SSM24]MCW3493157.1 SDR family oxidoreductase [Microbacterium sp. SSM24]